MYMAPYFGKDELKLESTQMIITILIIQLVAIAGAWLFSIVSKNKQHIRAMLHCNNVDWYLHLRL